MTGKDVKIARVRAELTQAHAADKLGIFVQALSLIERGIVRLTQENYREILEKLGS